MVHEDRNAKYWLIKARRLRYFVNLVAWFERFLPVVVGVNLVACCTVVYMRGQEIDPRSALWGILGVVCLMAIGTGVRGRGLSLFSALLRIETAMRLNNYLTTAYEGHISWPAPKKVPPSLYIIQWQRSVWACLFSSVLLLAALIVPIGYNKPDPLADNPAPPLALSGVEEWIEQISEEAIIEKAALDELKQAVEDLKSRPSDEWYTAGALEAADSLNEQMARALSTLAHELQTSSALLQGVENLPDSVSPEQLKRLSDVYQESMRNLETGALPLSSEMLNMMRQADFNQIGNLDPSLLQELQARSKMMAQTAQLMSEMTPEEQERLEKYYESLRQGMCEGGLSEKEAPGGIGRGRDDAEMSYSQYRSPDQVNLTEGVSNPDLRQAAIADTMRTTMSQQREGGSGFSGSFVGGGVESLGDGGDAVWVDRLTPAERKILQNYFK